MTIKQAHKELDKQYAKALEFQFVDFPVAWALYQTWKKADENGRRCKK